MAQAYAIRAATPTRSRANSMMAFARKSAIKLIVVGKSGHIIEELVGDIQDEFDQLPMHTVATPGGWVIGGGVNLNQLQNLSGLDLTTDLPAAGRGTSANGCPATWVARHAAVSS